MPADAGLARWPLAFVAVQPGGPDEQTAAIHDVLVLGRDCSGVDAARRLLIDDETVSRRHVEVRLDPGQDRAYLFDTSTNGTWLNGSRIPRAVPVPLAPGDRFTVGAAELEFRSDRFLAGTDEGGNERATVANVRLSTLAMVSGDLIGYPVIAQYTDEADLLAGADRLHKELSELLRSHGGAVHTASVDAFLAVWEFERDPTALDDAVSFALAAAELVDRVAPELPLRTPDDEPVRMGWGVEVGKAAVSALGGHITLIGDAANLALHLAESAGQRRSSDRAGDGSRPRRAGREVRLRLRREPGRRRPPRGRTGLGCAVVGAL